MKRRSGNDQCDVARSRKYPMPGTDLGYTNAIPTHEAYDVDMSSGSPNLTKGPVNTMSFSVAGSKVRSKPGNPTRWE